LSFIEWMLRQIGINVGSKSYIIFSLRHFCVALTGRTHSS
jgi:hypothetical protein